WPLRGGEIGGRHLLTVHVSVPNGVDPPEPVAQLRSAAHGDDRKRAPPVQARGRGPRLQRRHGGEPVAVQPEVLVTQTEQLHARHLARDLARRLDGEWERADEESLGCPELRVRYPLGPDPIDLMEQLAQGTVRHVRADFSRRLPVAEPAVAMEGCIRAVRPALLLPQDEEESRVRPAAEDLSRDAAGIVDR